MRADFDAYGSMLPSKCINILDLYFNESLSLPEISNLLGITPSSAREQLNKALYQLKKESRDPELVKAEKILYSFQYGNGRCSNKIRKT